MKSILVLVNIYAIVHSAFGVQIVIEKAPIMGSVQLRGKHECTSAIISENKVISAGPCLMETKEEYLSIVSGVSEIPRRKKGRQIKSICHSPLNDNFTSIDCTVAIATLFKEIEEGDREKPIEIPNSKINIGTLTKVKGWQKGRNDKFCLDMVNVTIADNTECEDTYKKSMDGYLCVKTHRSCIIDPGSILVYQKKLYGIKLAGSSCGKYHVYADICKLANWIDDELDKD